MTATSQADLTFTPRDPMKFEKIADAFLAEYYGQKKPALFFDRRF